MECILLFFRCKVTKFSRFFCKKIVNLFSKHRKIYCKFSKFGEKIVDLLVFLPKTCFFLPKRRIFAWSLTNAYVTSLLQCFFAAATAVCLRVDSSHSHGSECLAAQDYRVGFCAADVVLFRDAEPTCLCRALSFCRGKVPARFVSYAPCAAGIPDDTAVARRDERQQGDLCAAGDARVAGARSVLAADEASRCAVARCQLEV